MTPEGIAYKKAWEKYLKSPAYERIRKFLEQDRQMKQPYINNLIESVFVEGYWSEHIEKIIVMKPPKFRGRISYKNRKIQIEKI